MGDDAMLLIDAAAQSLRGGKRLRAAFCYWGWRAVIDGNAGAPASPATAPGALRDADAEREIISVAASLEIFQSAALVHDDIIDNSDTRRGQPASHRALEARHGANGWAGDGDAFGRAAALLLGDLLVAWSDDLLEQGLEGHTDAAARRRTRHEYAAMRRDVTLGQFLDIAEESAFAVSPGEEHLARALRVATYKSARYSVQQPLTIGAALAGGTEAQLEALASFGPGTTEVVEAVNFNDPVQTVIAGTKAGVDKACEVLKAAGAKRALLLPVSAPFHSSLMKPAAEKLRVALTGVALAAPQIPVLNNVDVAVQQDADAIRDALYRQAFGPVRWVECVQALKGRGVTHIVECGPGKVLAGLTKRIDPELVGAALFDSATLAETRELLA